MSTFMIVYIASVVTGITVFIGCLIGALIILSITMFSVRCSDDCDEKNKPIYFKVAWASLVLSVFLGLTSALIPSSEDVYKIAGVSAQEKASIDASGKIVMQKNNSQ